MKTFTVYGSTIVSITMEVEAESEEEALTKARDEFECLSGFCGNGGSDKLIGTTQHNVSLEASEGVDFEEAVEVD